MMADNYGGKRKGAGRVEGTKNKFPKNTSKIKGKEGPEKKVNKAVDEANKNFIQGLSGEMQQLYKGFSKRHVLPLDDLRELAQSMKARYNIGLRSEMQAHETMVTLAKDEKSELIKTGKISGQKASEARISTKLRGLEKTIMTKYYISSSLTTLSAELKNLFVEIERIDAGQPTGNVNIFNLLQGKGDAEKADALEEILFTPDEDILEQQRNEELADDD